ncbi:complement regulator-acquiring protein [Borreliella lusitaniae]|uniref:complement regulator-acquiring protein n=1 Tax=Borreliella lusitaniae TaxID=100177 RepID=UPI00292E1E1F|nr:complement regulator-acquiring protein [Borreliella lusitaniae]WNY67334.1 complement regulator-acquiring protein [Borreliella lusitaniae]
MKNNKLIAIFLLHALTVLIFLSCSLEIQENQEEENSKEKTLKSEKDSSDIKQASQNAKEDKPINNLLGAIKDLKNPPKKAAGNAKNSPNLAAFANSPNNTNAKANAVAKAVDPEVKALIKEILDRATNIIQIGELDAQEVEPADQFGMKDEIFSKIFFNANSTVHFDENQYKDERRMLYTSLNFKKDKIEDLGKILSKLAQDSNYRNLVKETLINRGFGIQLAMEEISAKILDIKDKLQNLNKSNLKTLDVEFKKLMLLKSKWLQDVENIIKEHNASNELQTDLAKLNANIESKNSKQQFSDIHNIILHTINTTTNILTPIK